jgi:hypothetical protein
MSEHGEGDMDQLAEYVDGLPNICGSESLIDETLRSHGQAPVFWRDGTGDPFAVVGSACAIALHKHQPVIPAGGEDLRSARRIGNLQYIEEHPDVGDNHNAPVFRWCDPDYRWAVEWLGCRWGHCVAASMPVQDFRLHVRAWQHQFVGVFGLEALGREEHTVEQPDGSGVGRKHVPHRLGLYEFGRRDGEHCRDHQDAGRRHEAGRTDAALLRGAHAWAVGAGGS